MARVLFQLRPISATILLRNPLDEKMRSMSTARISSKYRIAIPREMREQFGPKPGQKVVFIRHQRSLCLVGVPPIEEAHGFLEEIAVNVAREQEDRV
jgi:AbrB family looped-hinge helix DNA binding protein